MRREWPDLLETVGAMIAGATAPTVGALPWLPRRSGLCGFCPFAADCSLNAATTDDAAMTDWLRGTEEVPPAA